MSSSPTKPSELKQGSAAASTKGQPAQEESDDVREDFQTLLEDVGSSVRTYCKKRPQMAGLMIFFLGFYVGWKVKPW